MQDLATMVQSRVKELAESLRRRVHRALQIGALEAGARLPGTRELSRELAADPRVIADAYRLLAREGLVEIRPRSGVFIAPTIAFTRMSRPAPSSEWLANVLAEGIARGVPAPRLPGVLRAALGAGLRTVVIATTPDQTDGLCRELRDELGLDSRGVLAEDIPLRGALPTAVRRAQLLITTEAHRQRIGVIAARLKKPFVSISLRRDLFIEEWALFRSEDAYVVVADPRFARILDEYLRGERADEKVHVLVAGRDDLARLPEDAPLYVTQAARARVGATRLPVGLLPVTRILSDDCIREILHTVIVAQRDSQAAASH